MKKIYVVVLSVITSVAVIFGCLYHLYGGVGNDEERKNDELVSKSFDFDDIEIIDVDAGLIDLNIERGDGFSATYTGRSDYMPIITGEDKTLKVIQEKNSEIINFNFFKMDKRKNIKAGNLLTITVPEGAELTDLNVQCALGDIDIKDVLSQKIEIECGLGDIKISDSVADGIVIEGDMGDITFDAVDVNAIDAELSMGNFEAELVRETSDYSMDLSVTMGKCKVDGKSVSNKYSSSVSNDNIKIECDMGDIDIK